MKQIFQKMKTNFSSQFLMEYLIIMWQMCCEFLQFSCVQNVHFSVIRFDSLRTSFLIIFAKNMQKRTDYERSRQFAIVFLNFRRHPIFVFFFFLFSVVSCALISPFSFKCVSCYFYFVPKQRKLNVLLLYV